MTIYISLPISGYDIESRKELASAIADKLRTMGHKPVNPLETPLAPEDWDEKRKYAYYMGEDIKRLMMCDAILMVDPKWLRSKGCYIEHTVAERMGIEVFYDINQIPDERMED